jgi:signal transduction histidine kinase
MATAPAFEQLRSEQMNKLVSRLLVMRLRAAPVAFALIAWFAWSDSAPWRRYGLVGMFVTFTTVQALTLWQLSKRMPQRMVIGWNTAVMSLAFMAVLWFTGGVDSPITPGIIFLCGILPVVLPRRAAMAAVLTSVAGLAALTVVQAMGWFPHALPDAFGGGPYAGTRALVAMRGGFTAITILVGMFVYMRVRNVLDETADRAISTREEALADYAEQNRTMTLVAGEIAHELKNPLASIKGLSSLVARELQSKSMDKAAEQMAVLRREVDRMQNILEEFLNFSRPLVPLSLAPFSVADVCVDVARLHAGVAAERGVEIDVQVAGDAQIRADRRKVKQVLVNLVQNALDASPSGSHVELSIDRAFDAGPAVRVRVRDRGTGLAEEVASRAFDAGVTTKANGSGLGLTLSRALARQHGGDLTLGDAEGGGCVAELVLPEEARS